MTRLILLTTLCVIKFVVALFNSANSLFIGKYERRDQATKGPRAIWVESTTGEPSFSTVVPGVT